MRNRVFTKLNRYYYKQYLLVLVLFVLAFVFGKNMNVLTPQQQQLQDLAYAQQRMTLGIYDVASDQQEYELKNQFVIKNGQCGRLFFDLKNLPLSTNSTDSSLGNPNIKILLSNDLEENQELGTYELKNDQLVQNKEVDFCANADYSDLIFQKDENNLDSAFEISDVAFYPLSTEKHNFSGLITPVVGNTDFSNIIYQSGFSSEDVSETLRFSRKNQKIGQTFVANSDIISGVDLKLAFTGVGGMGNYLLELRDVNDQNGKITLSPNEVARFYFDKDSAEKDLKIEDGIYHVPLVANLEKGKIYFIGISNEAVNFNILNTLKIYGGTDDSSGEKIMTSVGGKVSERSGGLYLKVYGTNYVKVADDKILTGAKILDNGDGTGLYTYEQKGNFSDYLDLDQLSIKGNSNVFYDNVQNGISGKDMNDNAFVYKVDTEHPFTKMKIEAKQPGGEFADSLVYYSFDNKNWQEIKSDWDKSMDALLRGDKDKFQELIQGDGKIKTIYIKVTYNKDDAKEKTIHLFGLRSLKVNAQLVMGK